jgi:hypothetical protein
MRRGEFVCFVRFVLKGASMKSRHPNLEWMKKVLADLECHRGDPQIAALMGDPVENAESVRESGQAPFEKSSARPRR